MKTEKDYLTKDLFGKESPKKGEKGYLEPGFHFDKDGNIVDDKGNIYDEGYNLIKEAPSEEWKKAMEMARHSDPNRSDDDLKPSAEYYYHRIMTRKQKEEESKRKKGKSK
jgi:hypothetical protein